MDLKSAIRYGALSGVLWGWAALIVNSWTKVMGFESTFAHNLMAFSVGGALLGAVSGGLMKAFSGILPFKKPLPNAILVSFGLWVVLRLGGAILSSMEPDRYHLLNAETIQGLSLSVLLGIIMGLMWKERRVEA